MIELLFSIIVFCVVAGLLFWLVTMLPLAEPFPTVIRVCVVVMLILILLSAVFGGINIPRMNFR